MPLPALTEGKGLVMKHKHIVASFQLEVDFKSLVIMLLFSATEGVSHSNRSVCFKTQLFNIVWISKTHFLVHRLSAVTFWGAYESWTSYLDIKGM